jgi:CBS domain-containing protein
MTVRDILERKGATVHCIAPTSNLIEAAQVMMQHRIGCLVVACGESVVGIFTERDLLRLAAQGQPLQEVRVEQAMTRDVITGSPDQPVAEVMGVLTEKRIRHLPIVENGRLIGMISIGDVVKFQYDALQFENHFLKSYIVG